MHIREIAEKVGYHPNTIRTFLGRAEFASLEIRRGEVTGVTPEHIARLKFLGSVREKPKVIMIRRRYDKIHKRKYRLRKEFTKADIQEEKQTRE